MIIKPTYAVQNEYRGPLLLWYSAVIIITHNDPKEEVLNEPYCQTGVDQESSFLPNSRKNFINGYTYACKYKDVAQEIQNYIKSAIGLLSEEGKETIELENLKFLD